MFFSIIFLSTFQQDLPIGLALCVVPLLLGWGIAFFWFNVTGLREQIRSLITDKNALTETVAKRDAEITDLRVKLSQAEAEIQYEQQQIKELKSTMISLKVELEALREAKTR